MSDYPEIAARFAEDTSAHRLQILKDDGLYRHLRFSSRLTGWGEYWFDLITWPGCLTIRGDYGEAYTFTRELDMLPFFRADRRWGINPHYWAQKLDGHRQHAKVYSEDAFRQVVCELFVEAVRYSDAPRGLGKAVRAEILNQDAFTEDDAHKLLDSFEYGAKYKASCSCGKKTTEDSETLARLWRSSHIEPGHSAHVSHVERQPGFTFGDTWELSFRDYERDFLWACHAIVWGIARYDRLSKYGLQKLATPAVEEKSSHERAADATPGEDYPGELDMLRGLARTLRTVVRPDDTAVDVAEVRRLLHHHASDDAAARQEASR